MSHDLNPVRKGRNPMSRTVENDVAGLGDTLAEAFVSLEGSLHVELAIVTLM